MDSSPARSLNSSPGPPIVEIVTRRGTDTQHRSKAALNKPAPAKPAPVPEADAAHRTVRRASPRLGELLVNTGNVERDVVDSALREQRRTRRPLGEILVSRGVPLGVVTMALLRQARSDIDRGRLGELLVEQGLATPKQIGAALHRQVVRSKRLGDVLVDEGVITEEQLEAMLTEQQRRDASKN